MSSTLLSVVSRLPRPTSVPALLTAPALIRELSNWGTRVRHCKSARRLWPDSWRLQLPLYDCCRLVLPYHAVKHATDGTDPCDPPRMGRILVKIWVIFYRAWQCPKYSKWLLSTMLFQELPGQSDKCCVCGKKLFIIERCSNLGFFFHKQCYRCAHCDNILKPGDVHSKKLDNGKGRL